MRSPTQGQDDASAMGRLDDVGPEPNGTGPSDARLCEMGRADARDHGLLTLRHARDERGRRRAYEGLHAAGELARPAWFWGWLLARLDGRPGMRLLDVACGASPLPALAAARGLRVTGVDLSAGALRRARRAAEGEPLGARGADPAARPARYLRADGERLPLADGGFDRVACIGSLEHFGDPARGASELARALAPGGRALVLLPNAYGLRGPVLHAWRGDGELPDDGQPVQRFGSRGQWAALLRGAGLVPLRVEGCESLTRGARDPRAWLGALRHPSRVLALAQSALPANLSVELLFTCAREEDHARHGTSEDPGAVWTNGTDGTDGTDGIDPAVGDTSLRGERAAEPGP